MSLSLWCLPYLASKSLELCQLCLTKNQLSQISSKRTMPTHPANLNVGKQAQYQHKTTDDCEHLCPKNKRFSCPFKLPSKETLACSGVPYCQAFNVHNCFLGVQTLFKAERRRLFGCHTTNFTPLLLRWFNTFATWTPSIQMSDKLYINDMCLIFTILWCYMLALIWDQLEVKPDPFLVDTPAPPRKKQEKQAAFAHRNLGMIDHGRCHGASH